MYGYPVGGTGQVIRVRRAGRRFRPVARTRRRGMSREKAIWDLREQVCGCGSPFRERGQGIGVW